MNMLETAKRLFERYESLYHVINYYGLFALYGLAHTAVESKDREVLEKCLSMLGKYPDQIEHPYYNFDAYEAGGKNNVKTCTSWWSPRI